VSRFRRRRLPPAAAVVAALLVVVVACAPPRRSEPLAGALPVAHDPALVLGEAVYARHCHECHPRGGAGLGPSLNDKPWPAFMIRLQVRNGLGVMPRFDSEQISGEELDALVSYILALRRHPQRR
jgi:mono/diheme cytochrome c family protein